MGEPMFQMFMAPTAETVGTPRTVRIADEPFDVQIRNAGMSVMDAMLSAGKDRVVEFAAGTEAGQRIIQEVTAQQQQQALQRWGPFILIGLVVLAFLFGSMLRR